MKKILIVDDDKALGRSLQLQLSLHNFDVTVCDRGADGLTTLENENFDAMFLDLTLPDFSGLDILQKVGKLYPNLPVVIISGRLDMEATINAIKFGAFDYIRKPLDLDNILLTIEKLKFQYSHSNNNNNPTNENYSARELVATTPAMLDVLKQIGLLSRSKVSVLILGKSGTGKELVARALHEANSNEKPFIAINCSALTPSLLESELFGYEKGAFTGANQQTIGKLEAAENGTVFFDEIGDMPLDLQAKLLRVLQENEFSRVGGVESVNFAARAIFATHRDLASMVAEGTFRQDLYYRIAVAKLQLPPLRERRADIEPISNFLLQKIARNLQIEANGIEEKTLKKLQLHDWPGNVRELENVLTRALALSYNGVLLPENIIFENRAETTDNLEIITLAETEKNYISKVLTATNWNISRTAKLLDISPNTLRKKITDYQITQ
ncbi:MAG: sigma-54-dependent transcriptional regulator [Lentisphaeria bacterium]